MAAVTGNVAYSFIDQHTGDYVSFLKVEDWHDGTAMNDSKCDGVIYRKDSEGNYYKRVLPDGRANLHWWGVKPGDDIFQAFHDAIKAIGSNGHLFIPEGTYTSSGTLTLYSFSGTVEGEQGNFIMTSRTTTINVAAGFDGLLCNRSTAFPGTSIINAMGWTIKKLCINGAGKNDTTPVGEEGEGDDPDRLPRGFAWFSQGYVEDLRIGGFPGEGCFMWGQLGATDTSLSIAKRMSVSGNGSHGIYVVGPDANMCYFEQFDSRDNGGWGVYDSSFLGNVWLAPHTNNNALGAYKCTNSGNSRAVFFAPYGENGWPIGSHSSDFGTAYVFGGFPADAPTAEQSGKYFGDVANGIMFADPQNKDLMRTFFQKGVMNFNRGDLNVIFGNAFGSSYDTGNGDIFRLGPSWGGGNDMTPMLSILGKNAKTKGHEGDTESNAGFSKRSPGHQQNIGDLRRTLINNRRVEVCCYSSINHFLNTGYEESWGQWHVGDIILNGNIKDIGSKVFAWRCVKNGTLRRDNADLSQFGDVSFTPDGIRFPDSGTTLEDVMRYIKVGDVIKVAGEDGNGLGIIINISHNEGANRFELDMYGNAVTFPTDEEMEWDDSPEFEPIMMPGHFHPDFLPPVYADEAAAITGGLVKGDVFRVIDANSIYGGSLYIVGPDEPDA